MYMGGVGRFMGGVEVLCMGSSSKVVDIWEVVRECG